MKTKPYTMTAADFRDMIWAHIKDLPDNYEITFGQGDLSFYRPKDQGGSMLNLEFNQVYTVTMDPEID